MAESQRRFRIKASIEDITPPIWRTIEVAGTTTLPELHEILQHAFGWQDCHMHEFIVGVTYYVMDNVEADPDYPLETGIELQSFASQGTNFRYLYDMGDGWYHSLTVEHVDETAGDYDCVPRLLDGARSCPPEDCGGTPGYETLLKALADPADPEHDSWREWVGEAFDPAQFDRSYFENKYPTAT